MKMYNSHNIQKRAENKYISISNKQAYALCLLKSKEDAVGSEEIKLHYTIKTALQSKDLIGEDCKLTAKAQALFTEN
jgi:hypothetical protein